MTFSSSYSARKGNNQEGGRGGFLLSHIRNRDSRYKRHKIFCRRAVQMPWMQPAIVLRLFDFRLCRPESVSRSAQPNHRYTELL